MTRKECLDRAAECVLQDRASQYGGPEDNFGRIARLWSVYTGTVLDGIDVAMMMALLKVARIRNNKGYEDGYIDLAGYAACGAELAGAEKIREDATLRWGEEYRRLRAEAEGDAKAEGWEEIAMADAEEVEKVFGKPDGGRCQNGKDHANPLSFEEQAKTFARENPPEEPELKPGEKVEVHSITTKVWQEATIVDADKEHTLYRVRFPDGTVSIRPACYVRHVVKEDKPQAEGCEELVQRIKEVNPAIYGEKKEQE